MCVCGGGGVNTEVHCTLEGEGREEEGGGGRRERGQSTGDGQIGIEKCIRVRVCFFCVSVRKCMCMCM